MKKQKLKILFRTAGGKEKGHELGLGHIYRTMNLGGNFKKSNIHYLLEDFGGVKKILEGNGFTKINYLKKNLALSEELNKTIQIIDDKKIDVVVIDRHNINPKYIEKLSKVVKTVAITDLNNIHHTSTLLVNGFIGFTNVKKKKNSTTKYLLGPKYQIINKNFENKSKIKLKKNKILVTFGGTDEKNITGKIIPILEEFKNKIKFTIILGPVAKKSQSLKNLSKKYPHNIIVKENVKNMYNEISKVDFGICSGGITTYEFAATGTPFAIICDEKHQLITAKEWEKQGIGINLGMVNQKTIVKTTNIIKDVLNNKIKLKKGSIIVDGKGSNRIANEILKIT